MKYLGIDYGKTKMGLSLSEGQVASFLEVKKISGLRDALEKISQVVRKEEVERVVVGLPESGEARKITEAFLKDLKQKYQKEAIEVISTEETLSSFQARELMHELDFSQSAVRKKEDGYAAVIILQTFLDSLQ